MVNQEAVTYLFWNDCISVANITVMSYDYLLLFEKEVEYVWKRQWSPMSGLYLVVRYLGIFLAMVGAFWGGLLYMPQSLCHDLIVLMYWGFSVYFCFAEVILIWRLYAIYDQSKRTLYILLGLLLPIVILLVGTDVYLYSRPSAFSVDEIAAPSATYCKTSFNLGPIPAIYTSLPIVCYDILLVVLAAILLVKHLKERKDMQAKPNFYVLMIVRYHIMYFLLNLTNQILITVLWANIPLWVRQLAFLFTDTVPFILGPRLIISIWDTHASEDCVYVSTVFADCVCWTSLAIPDPILPDPILPDPILPEHDFEMAIYN